MQWDHNTIYVGGDFNIIRYASEKNKDSGVHRHTGLFNNIISTLDLLDIHMTGGKFTWSNNHSDPTLERLDRVLVNKDWESIFPTVFVYKLPREVSDHNPLILSTQTSPPPKKNPFQI